MKAIVSLAAAAFVFGAASAGACEWMKNDQQSVQAPQTSTVATLTTAPATPVKK